MSNISRRVSAPKQVQQLVHKELASKSTPSPPSAANIMYSPQRPLPLALQTHRNNATVTSSIGIVRRRRHIAAHGLMMHMRARMHTDAMGETHTLLRCHGSKSERERDCRGSPALIPSRIHVLYCQYLFDMQWTMPFKNSQPGFSD